MPEPTTAAAELAAWAKTLRWEDVPSDLRAAVRLRVADTLGLRVAAASTPVAAAVRAATARTAASPETTALVRGTLVHALDFDDTLADSVVHPSSVVVPAALSAVPPGASGARFAAALAAGYEVIARLGVVAGRRFHARGFQATGVLGPLAAALVAGTLRGRDPATVASAMGLSGSMSGGLLEFLADGTWSKRLHPGWAAHGGLVADELAAAGFPGPASVVEGRHGVYRAFLGEDLDTSAVTRDLGVRWASARVEPKRYPCAHVMHPFLDLVLALRAAHRVRPGDVEQVECAIAPWAVPIVCEPRAEKTAPVGEYQARASLPYAVAVALVDGAVNPAAFDDAAVGRTALLALAERVVCLPDPALDEGFGARLTLRTRDGRRLEADPATLAPAAVDGWVREKFFQGVTAARGRDHAAALWAAAAGFDRAPAARLLATLELAESDDRAEEPGQAAAG